MVRLGIVEWGEKKKAEGKIKYFGFSFHDNYQAFEHILTARKWDFCQIQLNYMDTEVQAGINSSCSLNILSASSTLFTSHAGSFVAR